MVSAFFVTDVRHAFVSVHILLEWEISRKSSGKPYFTAVLGVRIQPRTLWWISIPVIFLSERGVGEHLVFTHLRG